jgi:hypothetical protein
MTLTSVQSGHVSPSQQRLLQGCLPHALMLVHLRSHTSSVEQMTSFCILPHLRLHDDTNVLTISLTVLTTSLQFCCLLHQPNILRCVSLVAITKQCNKG